MIRTTGYYQQIGETKYFIPSNLPPSDPPLIFDDKIAGLYGEAMLYLGRLDEMSNKLPDANRFIKAYSIKEAILSSAIEGVHTTLVDVFTQPLLESKPNKSTQLVINYAQALDSALSMIRKEGLPIASRVILSAHKALMETGGTSADAGRYRKQSVRVGNLVPPPPLQVPELMAELERYIHTDSTFPLLIKAGLAHVQFETIHPFLDGNGRIGRLLIVLMLIDGGLLTKPALYPSYYFKKHHNEYYQRLDNVRLTGDFEGWITFYLTAIRDSSIDAYRRSKEIKEVEKSVTHLILSEQRFSKMRDTALRALSILFNWPVINIKELSSQLKMSYNTANKIIYEFIDLGFLVEESGQKRGKLFKFKPYLEVLEKEYPDEA